MKKYIVVSCTGDNIIKPDLFSDERTAYRLYANLLDESVIYLNEGEYVKYDFDGSVEEIKRNIKSMMDAVIKRTNNVWASYNGYVFQFTEGKYRLSIFEVEENKKIYFG